MPDQVTVDVPGMRELSKKLELVADDVAAVVTRVDRVPAPTEASYGDPPAVDAMGRVLSSWSQELGLLQQVCTMMSEAADGTADDWQTSDEQVADAFDLLIWPESPED